ncbi:MAG: hypothetical protein LBE38_06385 [Deltaproteobacteria bacterium]|jgi:hypothetical protein|nr:hypothetical protein [Deltaproteobacteria bacterium]
MKVPTHIKKLLLVIGIFLAFIMIFMEVKARHELNQARSYAKTEKDSYKAQLHYFQALNFYSPVGASQTAANELLELAITLDKNGKKEESYNAFLRLRGALNAARSFYIPNRDKIDIANKYIAKYLADLKVKQSSTPLNLENEEAFLYDLYSKNPVTNEFWYLVAVAGFLIWTICAIIAIFKVFPKDPSLPLKKRLIEARFTLIFFVIGYSLWLTGMSIA